jgi:hypothetical protein
MEKKGIEFGFNWIFAIIVGSLILFLALFTVNKFIKTETSVSDTFVAAELNNLIHPIETNLEDSKYVKIDFIQNTRVYNECVTAGNFGKQSISTSTKLGIGKDWSEKSVGKSSFNKYLFSREIEEGKELHVIVKPFFNPYKVGDLTMMYSGNYCFVSTPSDIKDDIDDLSGDGNLDIGINIVGNLNECKTGETTVCFNLNGCDVNVNLGSEIVTHYSRGVGEEVYYSGDLIYGAILSEPEVYECQLRRLNKRTSELAQVYALKAGFLTGQGCSNNLQVDLLSFSNTMSQIENSMEFTGANTQNKINELEEKNYDLSKCKVF